jgi:hypothetical protein
MGASSWPAPAWEESPRWHICEGSRLRGQASEADGRYWGLVVLLKKAAAAWPGQQLHVVCDNYATHNHPGVRVWLAQNPRVALHFTPTGCSGLNTVEIFVSIITRQAIRRGTYRSVRTSPPASASSSTAGTTVPAACMDQTSSSGDPVL